MLLVIKFAMGICMLTGAIVWANIIEVVVAFGVLALVERFEEKTSKEKSNGN